MLVSLFTGGVSLTHPRWLYFYLGSFFYVSSAGFIFMRGVSLIHPMLFLCGEFLLHIPCWLLFLIRGVSLTHPVLFSFLSAESLLNNLCCFIFIRGISLTHPVLTLFLCGEFLLHNLCWLPFYMGLSHRTMMSILSGEFLLHIPCWV